ncbi:hypothetical protein BO78DRAFT_451266 [Aspergillus sclerotiicarbonarius CBS 121057]|uniref:Uncharacterized protein n=1 Tax=Aspergillus sclerotiicarbonarius (strain CBS 121057 / IBT 28362) TaxID=1448318 RepID=A0A319ESB0_ASPSB|nr:hypothetical protein BO78DRAFT_451266 [Aspergillus sclerotiicarbonarius CBS 121057]
MASLFSDIAQEESQWDCITELASQLACVRAGGSDSGNIAPVLKPYYTCLLRDPRLYTLSSHLVEALLHNESRIDDCNIRQILSILKRESNRITHALDHSSLRCLAYTLLNSEVESGLENGLYLLLDEPQYIRDSGSMIYQVASPQTGAQSRLLQGKLIHKLYHLFSTEEQVIRVRKLAGKLLVEILSESKHNYTFLIESQDADMSGLLSILLYHADATLKAFATVIFHTLYNSGVSREILWPPDGTKDRGTFFKHLVVSEDSPLQLFYAFVTEADLSRDTKRQPTKSLRRNLKPLGCFLVQSIVINETPLLQGIVLTIADEYDLVFMNHRANTSRACLEYVDIRARDMCQPVRTEMDDSKVYRLTWDLSPSNLIFKNGRRQDINGKVLSIISTNDPRELQKTIGMVRRNNRGSTRMDPILRRSSSIMMELDTGEEVTRKSFDFPYNDFQTQAGPCKSPSSKQKPGNMMDKPPGDSRGKQLMSESQHHLDESISRPTTPQQDQQRVHNACSPRMPIQNPPQSGLLRQPNGRFAPRKQTDKRRTKTNPLSSNKAKLQLSNTQESMIIYARHSKRKVYTANSKAAVDWDEDLRPSDDEDNPGQKDIEVTSISSPLAGDTCVFNMGLNALGKKRVAKKGRRLATKRQNAQSRPKGNTRKQPKRRASPSADTGETNAEMFDQEPEHNSSAEDIQGKPDPGTSHNHLQDINMNEEDACIGNKCNDAKLDSTSANAIERGGSLMSHPDGDHNESLLLQATQSEHANAKKLLQESTNEINLDAHKSSTVESVIHVQGLHGRGRAVGNRLTAAFQQGDPSPGHSEFGKKRLGHPKSQDELKYPDKSFLPNSLYSPMNERDVHKNLRAAEPTMKEYIIFDWQPPIRTPHRSIMSKLDDDLNTEYSTKSPRVSTGSLESDDEEQEEEAQAGSSAASSTPRACLSEGSSSQPYGGSFRAEHNTCDFDHSGRKWEVGESSHAKAEKRKIATPSLDYIRSDADTGDHDSENPAEPALNVRKDNFHPTKRFKLTPRSTIVDLYGSPRLLSRGKKGYVFDEIRSGGRSYETSDAEEETSLVNQQIEEPDDEDTGAESEHDPPASCGRYSILSGKDVRISPHVPKKSEHSEDETRMRQPKAKGALTFQDRLMACAGKRPSKEIQPRNAAQPDLDAYLAFKSEKKPNETCNLIPRTSPSRERSPALPNSKPMKFNTYADIPAQQTSWQTSLQALHQRAQGMLVATSEVGQILWKIG